MAFVKLLNKSELADWEKKCLTVFWKKIALVNLEGEFYAVDNKCPHKWAQLCDGNLRKKSKEIVCWLHGWDFDLKTWISKYNPDDINDRIQTYKVKIENDIVYIDIDSNDTFPILEWYLEEYKRTSDDIDETMETIHKMWKWWVWKHGQTEAMNSENAPRLWDKIFFLPAQVANLPLDDNADVNLKTIIWKKSKNPIEIDLPVYVSHMSFWALSKEAKTALSKWSKSSGTLICSWEGWMLPEEFENAWKYIIEVASWYFSYNEENLKKADWVEIKMWQSAKAWMWWVLPAKKISDEIAQIRWLEEWQDSISPSHIPDINSIQDLKQKVEDIKKITWWKPVWIKFAASRVELDLKAAIECNPDFITIDWRPWATWAAPKHIKDNICIPTLYALDRVMRYFKKNNIEIDVLVTWGLRLPEEFAKAIAMWATAVASASSSLMAIWCQQYRACHTNKCPVGIASQDLYYRWRFDIEKSSKMLFNFFNTTKNQLSDFARICWVSYISKLNYKMIATTDYSIAKYTSIKHVWESLL